MVGDSLAESLRTRKTAADAYLRRMFKAFESCLPTNATKVPAGPKSSRLIFVLASRAMADQKVVHLLARSKLRRQPAGLFAAARPSLGRIFRVPVFGKDLRVRTALAVRGDNVARRCCGGFLYSAFAATFRAFRGIDFATRLRWLFNLLKPRAVAGGANNLSQNFTRSFHRDRSLKQNKN